MNYGLMWLCGVDQVYPLNISVGPTGTDSSGISLSLQPHVMIGEFAINCGKQHGCLLKGYSHNSLSQTGKLVFSAEPKRYGQTKIQEEASNRKNPDVFWNIHIAFAKTTCEYVQLMQLFYQLEKLTAYRPAFSRTRKGPWVKSVLRGANEALIVRYL